MSAQPNRRRLEVEHIGDVALVSFQDKKILEDQYITQIGDQLFGLVENEGVRKMVLNFDNVQYLSSAALGKLITLHKKLQPVEGKLVLCGIAPSIYEVFELTRLDRYFKIVSDEQTALQLF